MRKLWGVLFILALSSLEDGSAGPLDYARPAPRRKAILFRCGLVLVGLSAYLGYKIVHSPRKHSEYFGMNMPEMILNLPMIKQLEATSVELHWSGDRARLISDFHKDPRRTNKYILGPRFQFNSSQEDDYGPIFFDEIPVNPYPMAAEVKSFKSAFENLQYLKWDERRSRLQSAKYKIFKVKTNGPGAQPEKLIFISDSYFKDFYPISDPNAFHISIDELYNVFYSHFYVGSAEEYLSVALGVLNGCDESRDALDLLWNQGALALSGSIYSRLIVKKSGYFAEKEIPDLLRLSRILLAEPIANTPHQEINPFAYIAYVLLQSGNDSDHALVQKSKAEGKFTDEDLNYVNPR